MRHWLAVAGDLQAECAVGGAVERRGSDVARHLLLSFLGVCLGEHRVVHRHSFVGAGRDVLKRARFTCTCRREYFDYAHLAVTEASGSPVDFELFLGRGKARGGGRGVRVGRDGLDAGGFAGCLVAINGEGGDGDYLLRPPMRPQGALGGGEFPPADALQFFLAMVSLVGEKSLLAGVVGNHHLAHVPPPDKISRSSTS